MQLKKSFNSIKFPQAITIIMAALVVGIIIIGCKDHKRHGIKETASKANKDTATVYIDSIDFNPIVNVYIENSGSMDGYVKGQTEFEQIVYNYLVDIKLVNITNQLNLFYINSEILPQKDDIQDFIQKLEPSTFKARGGNRGSSDIAQMISDITQEMNDSCISVFISDCIFSPGKGKDANEYLNNQQIGIKRAVGEYFNKHPKLAVLGYRCMSSFDGYYYDKNDVGTHYKGRRPFYIWLFGSQGALIRMRNEMVKNHCQLKGVENDFTVFGGGLDVADSCYAVKKNSGNFDLNKSDPKHSILKLKADKGGRIRFSVEVNYAPLLLSDSYLCDTSMYRISDDKYRLVSVERIKEYKKYTHILTFETSKIHPSTLEIELATGKPNWPELYNDGNGLALNNNNDNKTFGIKYMTNGIVEAMLRKDYYTRMIININK